MLTSFIAGSVAAKEAPVTISSHVDRAKITIGDRVLYSITVEKPSGTELMAFNPSPASDVIEVKDCKNSKPKKQGSKEISEYVYTVTAYTTGKLAIPGLSVDYKSKDGNTGTASTETIAVLVESVLKGETAGADVKDIKSPLSLKSYLPFYVLAAACAVAALLYFFYFRRRKEGEGSFAPAAPPRPAHEIALEMLKKLEEMSLLVTGEYKKYYVILSEITRNYIENRYAVPAIERTTTELYQEMRVKGIERKSCAMAKELLDQCDLVKFAKFTPERKEAGSDMARAREFVELTKEQQILTTEKSSS